MSRSRLIPLLLAATVSLAVAGCGGDDKPTTTTQASAPPVTPTQTTPATTETTPTTATKTEPAPTTTDDKPSVTTPAAGDPLAKLKQYTKGGKPASAQETAEVRAALRSFGEAINKRDGKAICAHTVGLDQMLKAGGKGASCESLFKNSGSTTGPSKQQMDQINKAEVTVKGDRATLNISSGTPLPLRKVDGTWKVDYGAVIGTSPGAK